MRSARVVSLALLMTVLCPAAALGQRAVGPSLATRPATTRSANNRAAVIAIKGTIDDSTERFLSRQVQAARAAGAGTIILKFDTPGGLVSSTERMTSILRDIDDMRTVAYVQWHAYSAGTILAVACNEIVMQKGSKMGDAALIVIDDRKNLIPIGGDERIKMSMPIIEDLRLSARRNGYSELLMEAFVIPQRVVIYVENAGGQRRFVERAEFEQLRKEGWQPVLGVANPLDSEQTLLTLSYDVAEKIGLSRGTYSSLDDFVQSRNYQVISQVEPSAGLNILHLLANPWVRGIVLTVFLWALFLSFSHPGHGAAEMIALLSLAVLAAVPMLTGFATWWEVALIVVGVVLLALEIFVIPGFGVTGVAGILAVLGGLVLTFVPPEAGYPGFLPRLPQTWAYLKQGMLVVTTGLACSLFLWFWLQRYLPKLPYFNRLILTATSGGEGLGVPVVASQPVKVWPAVGSSGTAVTDLKPGGSAEFDDPAIGTTRVVDVLSESGYLKPGERVIVKENVGMRIVVKKA